VRSFENRCIALTVSVYGRDQNLVAESF